MAPHLVPSSKLLRLGAAVLIAATSAPAVAAPVQWSGNGHYYDVIAVSGGTLWPEARDACIARGGYLATLTSAGENAFVFGLVSPTGVRAWLGGFQPPGSVEPAGGWQWVSGEPWNYTNWHTGEPNNGLAGPSEDYLMFFTIIPNVQSDWNDAQGAAEEYVMEYDSKPTAVTSAANIPYSGISPGGVDMATGELILVMRPDLVLDGPMPVVFRRYYASMLAREGLASSPVGTNWLGTYDWSLAVGPGGVTIVTNRGKRIRFAQSPTGGYDLSGPTDENYRLTLSGGFYRLAYPSLRRIFLFDASTHLLANITNVHGNALTLSYVGGRLTQVSDGLGRALTFGYDALGFLTFVSDGTRSVAYGHAGSNLTSFTDASSRTTSYAYAVPPALAGLLSSVMEPLGNAPANYGYDTSGRVSTFTDALSHTSNYTYSTPTGNLFSDPLANTWTFQHDAQDRLMTLIDPATGPTNYMYDPQGRLSSLARPMGDRPPSRTIRPAGM